MHIQRLKVTGVRNLKPTSLEFSRGVNVISGLNGSGKTSLLEAIYLLGMGRSFRSSRLQPLVQKGQQEAAVFAELCSEGGKVTTVGLSRTEGGEQRFRVDREPAPGVAELARLLPVQVLDGDSFSLIDGGPALRRRFLDWGVFHVKPEFLGTWRKAQRALKQRNHLLRRAKIGGRSVQQGRQPEGADPLGLGVWEQEIAGYSSEVDRLRAGVAVEIESLFFGLLKHFVDLPGLTLNYRRGWKEGVDLGFLLKDARARDLERGFTQSGPHRANLEIKVGQTLAAEFLSRGQQKLVVSALKLALGAYLAEENGTKGVFLVDDLPAELDSEHRKTLCKLLADTGCQVFITCVEQETIDRALEGAPLTTSDVRRFHVEQGEYRCLTI